MIIPLFALLLFSSCSQNKSDNIEVEQINEPKIEIPPQIERINEPEIPPEMLIAHQALDSAVKKVRVTYNLDSTQYNWVYEEKRTRDTASIYKSIRYLNSMLTDEIIARCNDVNLHLRPLMEKIVKANSINKYQADSIALLYSDYDNYSGRGIIPHFLLEENYSLVWKSFNIIVEESAYDTCYINTLIYLNNGIRTNAELAEAMESFINESIKKNPIGFLDMYAKRKDEERKKFTSYAMHYDSKDEELMNALKQIANESGYYSSLAKELIHNIEHYYD
jgi:hypothetical protein